MLNHLIELRRRALWVCGVFLVFFMLFFLYSESLFKVVASPLLHALKPDNTLIATYITAPILTPLHLALDCALLATAPFVILQLWQFVAPGLYKYERKTMARVITISLMLFILGGLFCFYVVLPVMFHFFINAVPNGVQFMPDMTHAIDFIARMLLVFALIFQVPLLCLLLVCLRMVDINHLQAIRPYVIVAAFFLGMILTPPDVLSQILLAIPLCILYELGIVFAKFQGTMK